MLGVTQDRRVGGVPDALAVTGADVVAALSSSGLWLVILVAVVMLPVAGGVALALLARVLASPERDVRVRVWGLPRPGIEIDAKAVPASSSKDEACGGGTAGLDQPATAALRADGAADT